MTFLRFLFPLLCLMSPPAHAATLPPEPVLAAHAYLLYDYSSGQTLLSHQAEERVEPASLTKLMTAYLVFSALRDGSLTLEQEVEIPDEVTRLTPGESRMLLQAGQEVSVGALLRGLVVQSGNDAARTLARLTAGSEPAFIERMNREAQRLGLTQTHFSNPTGMPAADHYSSAADLGRLAAALIRDFPKAYDELFALRDYTFNGVTQANRNRLLWLDPHVDGMKTGHTEQAGYCLVSSAQRDSHRLIAVVTGTDSDYLRASESLKLLNYGFMNFDLMRLYRKQQPVSSVRVWKGTESEVALGFDDDLLLALPKGRAAGLKASIETRPPLLAPVRQGDTLATLKLTLDGKPYLSAPLRALDTVPVANVFSRGWDSLRLMLQ